MASSTKILLLCSILFLIACQLQATKSFVPKGLLLPISKDSKTLQYTAQIKQRTPLVPIKLVVYLGAPYLWVDCDSGYVSSSYRPIPCGSATCKLAKSGGCSVECYGKPAPGCHNNTCSQIIYNPYIRTSTDGQMARDVVSMVSTDGKNPGQPVLAPRVVFTCGSNFLLKGLASGAKGIAGLGRSNVSLPSEFTAAFKFPRKFSLCLGSKGVVFFGDGPYYFLPGTEISVKNLIHTPLILNPVSTAGSYYQGEPSSDYFINVTSIKVHGKTVKLNSTLLTINKDGHGGTMLSTVVPYTVMERSIYRALINTFKKQTPYLKKVGSIKPFKECFSSKNVGSTRVGPAVPSIDLVLHYENVIWKIFGANSMVFVKEDVMCLGFVDGGLNPTTSIVIGAYQLENNFLYFDLAKATLGFSSSLLFRQTTCSNFNFTSST